MEDFSLGREVLEWTVVFCSVAAVLAVVAALVCCVWNTMAQALHMEAMTYQQTCAAIAIGLTTRAVLSAMFALARKW